MRTMPYGYNVLRVPAIPPREMRPAIVNGLTAQAQWDYKAGRALPKLRVKGFETFPMDANKLRALFDAETAAA